MVGMNFERRPKSADYLKENEKNQEHFRCTFVNEICRKQRFAGRLGGHREDSREMIWLVLGKIGEMHSGHRIISDNIMNFPRILVLQNLSKRNFKKNQGKARKKVHVDRGTMGLGWPSAGHPDQKRRPHMNAGVLFPIRCTNKPLKPVGLPKMRRAKRRIRPWPVLV